MVLHEELVVCHSSGKYAYSKDTGSIQGCMHKLVIAGGGAEIISTFIGDVKNIMFQIIPPPPIENF